MSSPGPFFVVGAGRVGLPLALAMVRRGLPLVGIWSRSEPSAERASDLTGLRSWHGALPDEIAAAPIVILALPDPVVPAMAGALLDAGLLRQTRVVLHCGASRPAAEALRPLATLLSRGTLHPLLAFGEPESSAARLAGACFAIEGELEAMQTARDLALELSGRPLPLPAEDLALYHAAAVMASNHAVALWGSALGLLEELGLSSEVSLAALLPLLQSTLENLEQRGIPQALTGPVRRGDLEAVERHLELLQARAPELLDLYRAATSATVSVARRLDEPGLAHGLQAILHRLER